VFAVTQAGKMLPVTVITQAQSKQAKEAARDTLVKHGEGYHYKQVNKTMHILCDYVKNMLAPCYPVGERKFSSWMLLPVTRLMKSSECVSN
jgi:hypothetical protein